MTIDTTVRKVAPGRFEIFAGGGLAAIIVFSVGVFMMVVPVIGWIAGPSLMITAGLIAIAHFAGMFRKPRYAAHCPYCGSPTDAGEPGTLSHCETCAKELVHRDNHLCKVEA